jgi:DNA-binding transcriptional ArsR family regulator/uncharacterized protein YndB with AHSA1/START domain
MDDQPSTDPSDSVWKALADPTRRAILDELRHGPRTTGALAERFEGMTRFGVMKHLGVLVDAGLVVTEKRGRERFNHLNAVPLKRIYERWVSRYEDQWAGSLLRLKHAAERENPMGVKFTDRQVRTAHVVCSITIDAPRGAVWRAWFDRTADWFYEKEPGQHDGASHCEEKMGGKFYMDVPGGGFNVLGEVTMIKPGAKIRLRGDCTIPDAFIANMTIAFEDAGKGTKVTVDHRMSGDFDDDLPAGFDEGWMDGLTKLKVLCEG